MRMIHICLKIVGVPREVEGVRVGGNGQRNKVGSEILTLVIQTSKIYKWKNVYSKTQFYYWLCLLVSFTCLKIQNNLLKNESKIKTFSDQ